MNVVLWSLAIIVLLFVINIIFYRMKGADLFQQPLLFPPAGKGIPLEKELQESELTDIEQYWFEVKGGKVEAWFLSDDLKRSTIIFAHGNGGFIDTNLSFARLIQALGYHVMLVEYPGYGRSKGKPSEGSITEGFCQAFDWLTEQSNVGKIGGYGNSLGCSVVARLSKERPLELLVLRSGIASIAKLIAKKTWVPKGCVVNPFHSLQHVSLFKKPVMLLHGKSDPVATYDNAEAIHNVAENSELFAFNGGHDSPTNEEALDKLSYFFKKYGF